MKHPDFDPHVALLSAHVLEAKTTNLIHTMQPTVRQTGKAIFTAMARLKLPIGPVPAAALLEQLDKFLIAASGNKHWFMHERSMNV